MERFYEIYMVQRQSSMHQWDNVKAFISEERAIEHLKNCEAVSHHNVMRIEKELLVA